MYEVTFDGTGFLVERSSHYARFVVSVNGERRRLVVGYLDDLFVHSENPEDAMRRLSEFTLDRIRDLVEASPEQFAAYSQAALEVIVSHDDAARMFVPRVKRCEWLVHTRGAPFCGASSPADESARLVDGEVLAPTRCRRRFGSVETRHRLAVHSVTQVAMRACHDPSIAAKHYSGRVGDTDRALANAVASLLAPPRESSEE